MAFRSLLAPFALALALGPGLAGCGDGGDEGPGEPSIAARLAAIEGLRVTEIASEAPGQRWFVLSLEQPVDHADPAAGVFQQRLVLAHRDERAPLELSTQGYAYAADKPGETELTRAFGANLLRVEHRFFNASRPQPGLAPPWRYLTIRQAADDVHRVVAALKPIYQGPWFSDGASKGGMTAVYHRRFYPDDVAATVAYVAPQSYGTDDPRYPAFLERVGEATCRERIVALQRAALTRRAEIGPALESLLAGDEYTFAGLGGFAIAYEHAVQEYRFAFWQYGGPEDCGSLPDPDGDPVAIAAELADVARAFSDAYLDYYEPYYYQAATQLGQYGPLEDGLGDLLEYPGTYRVADYPPLGEPKAFDAAAMNDIKAWVATEATRILFVYGELDPWTAGAFEPGPSPDLRRFDAPGGNHGAKIESLRPEDQAAALGLLASWLGVTATPPAATTARTAARDRVALSWQRRWLLEGRL
ncbi:MAG TPA: S28 family serine protease [Polyangiaceae bacterium]|nr:S28 family serine protease [Polyangiaceae bacterium]